MTPLALCKLKKKPSEIQVKPKAKNNRFNGLTEEEIRKNSPPLPDYLKMDLDLVFVGINPSITAAYRGRYYAGPGNHFYKLLHESGLVSRFVSFEEDHQLLEFGIGLTNIVDRATRSSTDLSRAEIKEGSATVEKKLQQYKPKVAVFNGRCIYDVFANKTSKSEFNFGLQPERVGETALWVVPSSSARCSNFPRMVDKLKFYLSLKKYLSFVKGEVDKVDIKEFHFPVKKKEPEASGSRMWSGKQTSLFFNKGRILNKDSSRAENIDKIAFVKNEFVVKEIKSSEGVESFRENLQTCKNESAFEECKFETAGGETNSEDKYSYKETDAYKEKDSRKEKDSHKEKELHMDKDSVPKVACWRKIKNETKPDKIFFRNSKLSAFRTRENPSDFVSLIKQRIEAQKRKAENLAT